MRSLARHSHSQNYLKRFAMRILTPPHRIIRGFIGGARHDGLLNPLGKPAKEPFMGRSMSQTIAITAAPARLSK